MPPAFALLEDEPNVAVEGALVEALPTLGPGQQAAALDMIARRGHAQGLAAVVTRFGRLDRCAQRLVLERIASFFGGVRHAVGSGSLDERLSGLELIELSGDARLAYLLATAIRAACPRTRERAAAVLHALTARHIEEHVLRGSSPEAGAFGETRANLVAALTEAVNGWEVHLQPRALEAALYLPDELGPVLIAKMDESRSHITAAIHGLLEGATDWRLAGFALRALAMAPLRKTAAGVIAAATDDAFVLALGVHARLLADDEVRKGCLWIRELRFLANGADRLAKMSAGEGVAILWLIGASGLAPPRKAEIFREVLALDVPDLSRTIVHQLGADGGEWATELLTVISSRDRGDIARIAAEQLALRHAPVRHAPAASVAPTEAEAPREAERSNPRRPWERLWERFDDLSGEERVVAADAVAVAGADLLVPLRAKLASSLPLDRARALRIARTLRLVPAIEEEVYRLTSDHDAIVRSAAVAVLMDLPGVTSERILRRAVDDVDHRVQANAIEVLDTLDTLGRHTLIHGKLGSPHGRVRANAIKALLRLELKEAGDALLDMLDHPSRGQRLSALWVVEHLHLESLLHRLERMSRTDEDERVRQRAVRVMTGLTKGLATARKSDSVWTSGQAASAAPGATGGAA